MKKLVLIALLLVIVSAFSFSNSVATNFYVYGYLQPSAWVSATYLYFGAFVTGSGNISATSTVTVTATADLPYHIVMNAGVHYANTWRNIENSGSIVAYGIYKPGGGEWGDNDYDNTYPYGSSLAGTGDGTAQAYTATGYLHTNSTSVGAPANAYYTDVVTVTVYF